MTSAEGPSLAGPISERVVNPEALKWNQPKLFREMLKNEPSTKTSYIGSWCWHGQKCQLVGFSGRHDGTLVVGGKKESRTSQQYLSHAGMSHT
jgi:hypothetical protein